MAAAGDVSSVQSKAAVLDQFAEVCYRIASETGLPPDYLWSDKILDVLPPSWREKADSEEKREVAGSTGDGKDESLEVEACGQSGDDQQPLVGREGEEAAAEAHPTTEAPSTTSPPLPPTSLASPNFSLRCNIADKSSTLQPPVFSKDPVISPRCAVARDSTGGGGGDDLIYSDDDVDRLRPKVASLFVSISGSFDSLVEGTTGVPIPPLQPQSLPESPQSRGSECNLDTREGLGLELPADEQPSPKCLPRPSAGAGEELDFEDPEVELEWVKNALRSRIKFLKSSKTG
jgi:hypothetical protein